MGNLFMARANTKREHHVWCSLNREYDNCSCYMYVCVRAHACVCVRVCVAESQDTDPDPGKIPT